MSDDRGEHVTEGSDLRDLPGIPLAPEEWPASEEEPAGGWLAEPPEVPEAAMQPAVAPDNVPPDRVPYAQMTVSVWAGIGFGLFVVVANTIAGVVALLVPDQSWPEWARGLLFFSLVTASYAVQLLLVRMAVRRRGLSFASAVGLNPFPIGQGVSMAAVVSVVGRLLAAIATLLLGLVGIRLPVPTNDPTAALGTGPVSIVLILLLLMVIAPISEEIVFRGVVLPSLHVRFGSWWAIVGSGVFFAAVHLQPATVVAIVFVGMSLGWIAVHYRSIWPSIITHSLFNGVSAAAILYLRSTGRL